MVDIGGFIDMKNGNALIALAYIKTNDNPLTVFCNYVIICLMKAPNNHLSYNELSDKIANSFGIRLPHHVLKICCRILTKNKKIESLKNGEGFKLLDFSFSLVTYETKVTELSYKERQLIEDMQKFVTTFGINWSYEEAREYLVRFLLDYGIGVDLFIDGQLEDNTQEEGLVSWAWYVGKYVTHLLNSDFDIMGYLVDIVTGLMTFVGVYETLDYTQDSEQKFRGTDFYLDTKLVLRYLGYSWSLDVGAITELVDLISKEYGGNVCVFEHTLEEVSYAFKTAADNLSRGETIQDSELRYAVVSQRLDSTVLNALSHSVTDLIEKKTKFKIREGLDWNSKSIQKNVIDWDGLCDFIKHNHPMWKDSAIQKDVTSVNYINVLRKGNYSVKYGGKDRLPVFITSNSALTYDVKEYFRKQNMLPNTGALPLVTDYTMMCRLWLPKAREKALVPTLTLARSAYAAHQVDATFDERFRIAALDLLKTKHIDVINVPAETKDMLEELIVKRVGDDNAITSDLLAICVDDLAYARNALSRQKILELKREKELAEEKIKEEQSSKKDYIVRSVSNRHRRKLGLLNVAIYVVEHFWVFSTVLFSVVGLIISWILDPKLDSGHNFVRVLLIALTVSVAVAEKIFDLDTVNRKMVMMVVSHLWMRFNREVDQSLLPEEMEFRNEILKQCVETSRFSNYSEIVGDSWGP